MNTPPPPDNSEGRRRFIADAVQHFYNKDGKPTAHDVVHAKVVALTEKLRQFIKPTLAAGGWKDEAALYDLIFKLHFEAFDMKSAFSREELAVLISQVLTEIMMETIKASPFGGETPDAMGGV